jgi:hypothetical protein
VGLPLQSSVWDERRNTSRVIPPAPDALPNALRALEGLRRFDPDLVQWIEDGHPTPTEAEHVARFRESYKRGRGRR